MSRAAARRRFALCLAAAGLALAALAHGDAGDSAPPDSAARARLSAQSRQTLAAARRPGPLRVGEDLRFDVHYGIVHAGEAHLQVVSVATRGGGRCFRLRSLARSGGLFGKLYDVDDKIESWFDSSGFMSRGIDKSLHEGSYHQEQHIRFDYSAGRACYASGDTLPIPGPVQDDLSALYVARCLDLRENQTYHLDTHSNKVTYPMQVKVYGRETLETDAGRFECFVVEPMVDRGGLFKKKGRMLVWMTVGPEHMPVRMRTKLPIGAITADLVSAGALKEEEATR